MRKFKAPKKSLGNLDAESAGDLLTAATDVALIIDRKGVIRDVAFGSDDLLKDVRGDWLNTPWEDTVAGDSRAKIKAMLEDADAQGDPRWRQVNHPANSGPDVPILYRARRVGADGRVVALGRDLRGIETLQQRLMEVEQSMEREYSRMRHAETRYRLLFQIASEAVLIVDAESRKVVDANPAALQIVGSATRRLVGRTFPEGFDPAGQRTIEALLAGVLATGRAEDARCDAAQSRTRVPGVGVLVPPERLIAFSGTHSSGGRGERDHRAHRGAVTAAGSSRKLPRRSRRDHRGRGSADGQPRLPGTGATGHRRAGARPAAGPLAGPPGRRPARAARQSAPARLGAPVRHHAAGRVWLERRCGDLRGLRHERRTALPRLHRPQCREARRRDARNSRELPRTAAELTELIGRVSLKELVRETTDVIERLCIEAALQITGDNRATAAEMLGLSRQSLYVKLRRYGLGDLSDDA